MTSLLRLPKSSGSFISALYNKEQNCGEFHFLDIVFLLDAEDFNKLSKHVSKYRYDESEEYPYIMDTNSNKVLLIESIFIHSPKNHKYVFENGNTKDLRRNNVSVYHLKHDFVIERYPTAKYLGGHYVLKGKNAYNIQNPVWELTEKDEKYYLMYAYPDKLSLLCEEGMIKLRDFEREHTEGKRITWSCINGFHLCGGVKNERIYALHQILMGFYGNGKGTSGLSIDHIDRDPLNNCLSNLRIATRKMQEENTTGIMPDTKRKRNYHARELPEGITHEMMKKCMVYNVNVYNKEKGSKREYFSIENHPKLEKTWESSKSNKVSIIDKYNETVKVLDNLDKGIFPEKKKRELPPHMMIMKNVLVFDWKKKDGPRMNAKFELPEGEYDLEQQVNKMREIIEAKYGPNSYI